MKVYLDNCCFNRPFDDQSSLIVHLETEAKLYVQELIKQGRLMLLWSFMLDYENKANPFVEIRSWIARWKKLAMEDCEISDEIQVKSKEFMLLGIKKKDAIHLAYAVQLGAEFFITTDKRILNKTINEVMCLNPIDFVRRYCNAT